MGISTSALAIALLSLAPAHKQSVKRTMFVEPSGTLELQVIVAIRIPSGDPRRALEMAYNEKQLERLLVGRALDGLALRVNTATVSLEGVEVKTKMEKDGPIEVMIHAVARSPRPGAELSVVTRASTDPVDLVVLAGTRPVVSASKGVVKSGSLAVALGAGDRVTWRELPPR